VDGGKIMAAWMARRAGQLTQVAAQEHWRLVWVIGWLGLVGEF